MLPGALFFFLYDILFAIFHAVQFFIQYNNYILTNIYYSLTNNYLFNTIYNVQYVTYDMEEIYSFRVRLYRH